MSPVVFPITLALYAAACALYLAQVAVGVQKATAAQFGRAARVLLLAAFVGHALDIGASCIHGNHPASSAREALFFIGWLTVGAFLVATWKQPVPLAGALLVPVALVLDVAARVGPSVTTSRASSTLLATIHIGLATAGIAMFGVAAIDAVVYLIAEGQLKSRKRRGPGPLPWGSLPPLESLDRLNQRAIQIGFPLFTLAMVAGSIWLSRMPPHAGETHRLLEPQYVLSVLAWALYAGLLLLRLLVGWRGRRAALVTLGGFAASIAVVLVYYVRDLLQRGGVS